MRKKWLTVLIAVLVVFCFTGCKDDGGDPKDGMFEPGTYTATAEGFPGNGLYPTKGYVTVSVLYSTNRIEYITVMNSTEREPFRTAAMERIPYAIVKHQTLDVDLVSGATFTSYGIIDAVTDTLVQAGGDLSKFSDRPKIDKNKASTISTEVLVVGSGISGLSAAIEAKKAGADVLVIEKLGVLGGVSAVSGGMVHGADSSPMKARQTNDPNNWFTGDSAAKFANELINDLSMGLPKPDGNGPMLTQIANLSADTVDWFIGMGVAYPLGTDVNGLSGNPNRAWRGSPVSRALTPTGGGRAVMEAMIAYAKTQGIKFMSDMKAETLKMNGTAVAGVIATDITGAEVTINANKVILATGGFHNNVALMDQYHPLVRAAGFHVNRWHLPGANGEGLVMARDKALAAVVEMPIPIAGLNDTQPWGIWVTPEGKRFTDESWQYGQATASDLTVLGFSHQWAIMDNANKPANLTTANNTTTFTGVDIPALVAAMGQNAAFQTNLEKAIADYNDAMGNGGASAIEFASDYGADVYSVLGAYQRPRHVAIGAGPYWAQKSGQFADVWGTRSGLKVNLQGQVLNTSGGVIENLYAAGEVVGYTLPTKYGGSGMALTMWSNQGRIAGKAAGEAAK